MKDELRECCICEEEHSCAESITEMRPTGSSGTSEDWAYCLSCWFAMEALRRQRVDTDRLMKAVAPSLAV